MQLNNLVQKQKHLRYFLLRESRLHSQLENKQLVYVMQQSTLHSLLVKEKELLVMSLIVTTDCTLLQQHAEVHLLCQLLLL